MRFRYEALDNTGRLRQGELIAPNETEALNVLREKGLFPISIAPRKKWLLLSLTKGKEKDLLFFTEQLRRLLRSGIPLDKSLEILQKTLAHDQNLSAFVLEVAESIKGGTTFSEALKDHPWIPSYYVALIKAGEEAGALEETLSSLSRYLQDKEKFKQDLLSALLYPTFLVIFGLLAIQTVLVYILPKFTKIFQDLGVNPPIITKILLKVGIFWKNWGPFFLILALGALIGGRFWIKTPTGRKRLEQWFLKVPFIGSVWLKAELARIFRGLNIMVQGGVSIERALSLAQEIPKSLLLRETLKQAAQGIREGQKLSQLLGSVPFFEGFILELISIGEETGDLARSFQDVSQICEEEVRLKTKRLLTILEPVTILGVGFILGLMIISILLAIFSIQI